MAPKRKDSGPGSSSLIVNTQDGFDLKPLQTALRSENLADRHAALSELCNVPDSSELREAIGAEAGLLGAVSSLFNDNDATVRVQSSHAAARLCTWRGPVRDAICSSASVQLLWQALGTFAEAYAREEEERQLSGGAAAGTDAGTKGGGKDGKADKGKGKGTDKKGGKDAGVEPGLEEPELQAVDAAVRALRCMAFRDRRSLEVQDRWTIGQSLKCLLCHPNPIIVEQALRLMAVASTAPHMRMVLEGASLLPLLLLLIKPPAPPSLPEEAAGQAEVSTADDVAPAAPPAVPVLREWALKVAAQMAGAEPSATPLELTRMGAVATLVRLLAEPVDPEVDESGNPVPAAEAPSEADPAQCESIQAHAAQLLRGILLHSEEAAEQAMSAGLEAVVAALLPETPSPEEAAGPSEEEDSSALDAAPGPSGTGDSAEATAPPVPLPSAVPTSAITQQAVLELLQVLLCQAVARPEEGSGILDRWAGRLLFFLLPTDEEAAAAAEQNAEEAAAAAAAAKGGKGKGKGADEPELLKGPLRQHMPEFPSVVKRAACLCLAELSQLPAALPALTQHERWPAVAASFGEILLQDDAVLEAAASWEGQLAVLEHQAEVDPDNSSVLPALKQLAQTALDRPGRDLVQLSAARAVMALPDATYIPPPHPPKASPPPTPPPAPLPTSTFIWDALNKPVMTDGLLLTTKPFPGTAAVGTTNAPA